MGKAPLLQALNGPLPIRDWDDDDLVVVHGPDKGAGLVESPGGVPSLAGLAAGNVPVGAAGVKLPSGRSVADRLAESVSVKEFGVKGDGVTDDTVALQYANDQLQAAVLGSGHQINVYDLMFPPGDYVLSGNILKGGCRWIGQGVDNTRFIWNGDTSTDMVTQDVTARGGNAAGGIEACSFYAGTASRATFATYTAPTISASPTQAEVQAVADAAQVNSRTLKALLDDLTTHGLIGT